jgi:hypothetical protein
MRHPVQTALRGYYRTLCHADFPSGYVSLHHTLDGLLLITLVSESDPYTLYGGEWGQRPFSTEVYQACLQRGQRQLLHQPIHSFFLLLDRFDQFELSPATVQVMAIASHLVIRVAL